MATATKLVKMLSAGLSPELREFLDRCVVPSLLKKYFADDPEGDGANTNSLVSFPAPVAYSRSKRHRKGAK